MRQKNRDLSPREQQLIHDFILEVCRSQHRSSCREDFYQSAWEAFLSVYRADPDSFCFPDYSGWDRARLSIQDALKRVWAENNFRYYRQSSLDQSVSREVLVSRIQLLQAPHGDFQNSVCLHDYLRHIKPVACRQMAYCFIYGISMDEIPFYYNWHHNYIIYIYKLLQTKMREYIEI